MYIAIKTKLVPATNNTATQIRASVVSALGQSGKPVLVEYNYDLDDHSNHTIACGALRSAIRMTAPTATPTQWIGATFTGRGEMTHLYRTAAA